jgi:nickel-dependent lactate racemase
MIRIEIPFGGSSVEARLPDGADVLKMRGPEAVASPAEALREALLSPIASRPLEAIAREKISACGSGSPKACIVVSDNTRPVPYAGENGILMPVIQTLLAAGFAPRAICILIATGMHRHMTRDEMRALVGGGPFELGIEPVNHDCADGGNLADLGFTRRGTHARVDRRYVEADLKVLTGLVESHFMAGASGGPKSICPGLIGEDGTLVFHGPGLMDDPNSRDLNLDGNPVYEEALAVAGLAGADFIVNVTLDNSYHITGIFCGELKAAHEAAVKKLKSYVEIPIERPYDLVVTHGGFVALNHYQAAKAAVASLDAVAPGGGIILAADNRDVEPVGSDRYRTALSLLKLIGPEAFRRLISAPEWTFLPEQWQVQMWAKVFRRIDMGSFVYFAPQLNDLHWRDLPGIDGRRFLPPERLKLPSPEDAAAVVEKAVDDFLKRRGFTQADVAEGRFRIAFLSDGPYGIPMVQAKKHRSDSDG